jgi:hypothetical protein
MNRDRRSKIFGIIPTLIVPTATPTAAGRSRRRGIATRSSTTTDDLL